MINSLAMLIVIMKIGDDAVVVVSAMSASKELANGLATLLDTPWATTSRRFDAVY